MIRRQLFGRTGHLSTRTLFGAAALSTVTQERANRTLEVLLHHGVNHIDTAPSYGDAELRVGPWMERHRQKFFLATRVEKRTYQEAKEQFQRSLERLRVDQVDLLQLHNLVDPREWEVAMGVGGALEALIEAREQGLTRFIGVTGQGITAPAMHKHSLERFDFDAVLLPYNYVIMQNPQYLADFEALMTLCQERNVAVQTARVIARGPWGSKTRVHTTSYEPLESRAAIEMTVHWALGRPSIFINTPSDLNLLSKVLDAAHCFRIAPPGRKMEKLVTQQKMVSLFE